MNIKKLYDECQTVTDLLSILGKDCVDIIIGHYKEMYGGEILSMQGILSPTFRTFVVGYMIGLNIGETVGFSNAVKHCTGVIKDVFDQVERLEDEATSIDSRELQ